MSASDVNRRRIGESAILAGLVLPGDQLDREGPFAELSRLAETAGAVVVGTSVQKRPAPHPATFLGAGKAAELAEMAKALDADLVIFDRDLSPAQARNLEKLTGRRVVDRSELILDIFARRARTRQARVQVELAQLEYMRPRLKRMWTHLSRIEGGIGMRGPGEKQIEVDRRTIRRRLLTLRDELDEVRRQQETRSAGRRGYFAVSIVGYTNAGKSTLLRALTGAEAFIEDRLFATLDTMTRAWKLATGKQVFLSDTVGFIRGLPHHLVASFAATLAETRDADLLLHVVDASSADAGRQMETVDEVLESVGVTAIPVIVVLNKIDVLRDRLALAALRPKSGPCVAISAGTGEGLRDLRDAVLLQMEGRQLTVEVRVAPSDGRRLAFLAEKGRILAREFPSDGQARIRLRLAPRYVRELRSAGVEVLEVDENKPPESE